MTSVRLSASPAASLTDEFRADRVKESRAFNSQLEQPQFGPANRLNLFNDELFLIVELPHQFEVHIRRRARNEPLRHPEDFG